MKKKKYVSPEFDLIRLQLEGNVLLNSLEQGQSSFAGGDMDDPPQGDGVLEDGGFWL